MAPSCHCSLMVFFTLEDPEKLCLLCLYYSTYSCKWICVISIFHYLSDVWIDAQIFTKPNYNLSKPKHLPHRLRNGNKSWEQELLACPEGKTLEHLTWQDTSSSTGAAHHSDVRGIRLEHKISQTNVPFLSDKRTVFKAIWTEEIASFPAEQKALLET